MRHLRERRRRTRPSTSSGVKFEAVPGARAVRASNASSKSACSRSAIRDSRHSERLGCSGDLENAKSRQAFRA
eukprot:15470209-Alexandrium_andersonii.AAC.1